MYLVYTRESSYTADLLLDFNLFSLDACESGGRGRKSNWRAITAVSWGGWRIGDEISPWFVGPTAKRNQATISSPLCGHTLPQASVKPARDASPIVIQPSSVLEGVSLPRNSRVA